MSARIIYRKDRSMVIKDEALSLFNEAFSINKMRTPRSDAYKKGAYDAIYYRLCRIDGIIDAKGKGPDCPYKIPSAEADAWFSGCQEGSSIALSARQDRVRKDGFSFDR